MILSVAAVMKAKNIHRREAPSSLKNIYVVVCMILKKIIISPLVTFCQVHDLIIYDIYIYNYHITI